MRASTAALVASLLSPGCFLVHTSEDAGGGDAGAVDGGARDAGPLDCEPIPGVRVQDGISDPVWCRCPDSEGWFILPGVRSLDVVVCDVPTQVARNPLGASPRPGELADPAGPRSGRDHG